MGQNGDGTFVGIAPAEGSAEARFTYEPRPPVDNIVGVRGVSFEGFGVYRGLSETALGSAFRSSQVFD